MRLIDDILDLSKIEANKLELKPVNFDLNELFRDVRATMSFRAQENGVNLVFETTCSFEDQYLSDIVRIKQVLLNIIGNAIKFTPRGHVAVSIGKKANKSEGENEDEILFVSVTDDGVGLSAEQAERLFHPFAQADASTTRQFGGSGLGLVISRQIARALGGDIRLAQSQLGKGSTFEIELKLNRATEKTTVHVPHNVESISKVYRTPSLKGRKILAVDDSPDNLVLLSHFLKGSGVELTLANNGMNAISEIKKNEFDLILMDIQMPGMDGHETTSEIRRLNYKKPIIALTAHVSRSEHDKCHESGCDSVLTKPVSRDILLEKLGSYLDPQDRVTPTP